MLNFTLCLSEIQDATLLNRTRMQLFLSSFQNNNMHLRQSSQCHIYIFTETRTASNSYRYCKKQQIIYVAKQILISNCKCMYMYTDVRPWVLLCVDIEPFEVILKGDGEPDGIASSSVVEEVFSFSKGVFHIQWIMVSWRFRQLMRPMQNQKHLRYKVRKMLQSFHHTSQLLQHKARFVFENGHQQIRRWKPLCSGPNFTKNLK